MATTRTDNEFSQDEFADKDTERKDSDRKDSDRKDSDHKDSDHKDSDFADKHPQLRRKKEWPRYRSLDELKEADDWKAWTDYLGEKLRRMSPRNRARLMEGVPLSWNATGAGDLRMLELLDRFTRKEKRNTLKPLLHELERWLTDSGSAEDVDTLGLECIAWCRALPMLASVLPSAPWQQLLCRLLSLTEEAKGIDHEQWPLGQQILAGELPLTLACLFPELDPCRKLFSPACGMLTAGILELLDGEGMPVGSNVPLLRPLIACWTRCLQIAESVERQCFSRTAHEQFEWSMRQAMRLCREDKSLMFGRANLTVVNNTRLLRAAMQYVGDKKDQSLARSVLPAGKTPSKSRSVPKSPKPLYHSEWAGVALLRADWSPKSPVLGITYNDSRVITELNCGGEIVWQGPWATSLEVDGNPVKLDAQWDETCWYSDEEVVYVELATELSGGWRIERQIMLGRDDRFLFLADAVLGPAEGKINYRSSLPLAENVCFQPASESREGTLHGKKSLALVMPLGTPEWRSQPSSSELTFSDDRCLTVSATRTTARLFVPLFVDLDRRRFRYPFTWRKLTVAEQREIQPDDVAVGFRVQSSMQQWMFYRSLAQKSNRTLIGQNLCSEFYAARFGVDGECHELIEIE